MSYYSANEILICFHFSMPTEHTTSTLRQRPDRASELMNAALHHFARQDFNTVTIKDIASSISVNSALIYYYFENKEALFRASLDHAADLAIARYEEISKGLTTPSEFIDAWFDNHIESGELIRYMVKVMLDFAATHPQRDMIESGIQRFYGTERDILVKYLNEGMAQGVFSDVDVNNAAQVASTMLDGVIVRSQIQPEFDLAAAIAELKLVFWRYIGFDNKRRFSS
ncbi:MAG: TetR/AcrR family transcriptional regulator [Burkholderiales bacterium]|jgi:AcrR family transcriptional regulator|nr:TetR/AcrR family transcriptional regulator [Burkholderiales bacterium]